MLSSKGDEGGTADDGGGPSVERDINSSSKLQQQAKRLEELRARIAGEVEVLQSLSGSIQKDITNVKQDGIRKLRQPAVLPGVLPSLGAPRADRGPSSDFRPSSFGAESSGGFGGGGYGDRRMDSIPEVPNALPTLPTTLRSGGGGGGGGGGAPEQASGLRGFSMPRDTVQPQAYAPQPQMPMQMPMQTQPPMQYPAQYVASYPAQHMQPPQMQQMQQMQQMPAPTMYPQAMPMLAPMGMAPGAPYLVPQLQPQPQMLPQHMLQMQQFPQQTMAMPVQMYGGTAPAGPGPMVGLGPRGGWGGGMGADELLALRQMERAVEQLERENASLLGGTGTGGAGSSSSLLRASGAGLGLDDSAGLPTTASSSGTGRFGGPGGSGGPRSVARRDKLAHMESQHEEEMLRMQHQLEQLRQKRLLDEFKVRMCVHESRPGLERWCPSHTVRPTPPAYPRPWSPRRRQTKARASGKWPPSWSRK
jgi:hypothetical protein